MLATRKTSRGTPSATAIPMDKDSKGSGVGTTTSTTTTSTIRTTMGAVEKIATAVTVMAGETIGQATTWETKRKTSATATITSDPGILCFHHCNVKVFCFKLPHICPNCKVELDNTEAEAEAGTSSTKLNKNQTKGKLSESATASLLMTKNSSGIPLDNQIRVGLEGGVAPTSTSSVSSTSIGSSKTRVPSGASNGQTDDYNDANIHVQIETKTKTKFKVKANEKAKANENGKGKGKGKEHITSKTKDDSDTEVQALDDSDADDHKENELEGEDNNDDEDGDEYENDEQDNNTRTNDNGISLSKKLLPFRLPYPFVRASQYPCAIVLRPTTGDFLNDYNNSKDLHIAVTTSTGCIVEFDRHGLRRHRPGQKAGWDQCLLVADVPEAWYDYWDDILSKICNHQSRWSVASYNEDTHNCYTFVLTFLQALSYEKLSSAACSKTEFCEKYIVPRTTTGGKYISLYRKLRDTGVYVHQQSSHNNAKVRSLTTSRNNTSHANHISYTSNVNNKHNHHRGKNTRTLSLMSTSSTLASISVSALTPTPPASVSNNIATISGPSSMPASLSATSSALLYSSLTANGGTAMPIIREHSIPESSSSPPLALAPASASLPAAPIFTQSQASMSHNLIASRSYTPLCTIEE